VPARRQTAYRDGHSLANGPRNGVTSASSDRRLALLGAAAQAGFRRTTNMSER
jgi:hypothetical protein